jgi:hypothetical protein
MIWEWDKEVGRIPRKTERRHISWPFQSNIGLFVLA